MPLYSPLLIGVVNRWFYNKQNNMPLKLPDKLPAIEILKGENIFVMDTSRATHQDIRPLRIVVLNLMPIKITTETDLIRLLSNTHKINIVWLFKQILYFSYFNIIVYI